MHLGFPRSFSSLWQQAGRAGRSGRPSLSILVCHDSPVDQFFARNPTVLLNSPHEPATLNPDNIHVLRGHLLCAAMEITLNAETWTVGGHKGLSAGAGGTGQAVTFDDSQLWGVRYFDAAHSLLDTQDLVVSYTHNRVSMHDDTPPTLPSDAPSHPHFAPLPVPMPLPLWRMHPLHRLGSVPSKDVSLRLIDPITINVSTQRNSKRVNMLTKYGMILELQE